MKRALNLMMVLPLILASCFGRTSVATKTPQQLMRGSADQAREVGSAKILLTSRTKFDFEVPGSNTKLDYTIKGEGLVDFENSIGRMEFDFSDVLKGSSSSQNIPPNHVYLNKGTFFFIQVPEASLPLTGGKPWIGMDAKQLAARTGVGFGNTGSSDPAQSLTFLKKITKDRIERIGTESVRGVQTTHYRTEITLDTLLENVVEEARQQTDQQLRAAGINMIPIDVWFDGDGIPRRWTVRLADDKKKFESSTTTELFAFGVDVNIDFPRDADVFTPTNPEEVTRILGYPLPQT